MLERAGVSITPNRILVLNTISEACRPLSLKDLEDELETVEKSSIFRVLTLLTDRHVLHTVEDGNGIARYEICHAEESGLTHDIHAHFFCEKCQRVYCLDNIHLPEVELPDGFKVHSMNYMFKGLCENCSGSRKICYQDS